MADQTCPIVWILGAGFSAPLGGPMLADLLSLEARGDLVDKHALDRLDPGVFWLYHYGRRFRDGWLNKDHPPGENLWGHAEEFLDKLDAAALNGGALAERLLNILKGAPSNALHAAVDLPRLAVIRERARRYVAAECGEFLRRSDPRSEQWRAHVAWMTGLRPRDVVITFNYDRVLETIAELLVRTANNLSTCGVVRTADDWQTLTGVGRI